MHGVFARVLLQQLLDEAGGDRALAARRVRVGRTTMYRWIKAGLLDQPAEEIRARYQARPPVARKLEPFKAIIEERLREYPRQSACDFRMARVEVIANSRCLAKDDANSRLCAYARVVQPVAEPLAVVAAT
jgi:hypothetical protein